MGGGLLRLIATVMLFVMRNGLCYFFRGKFTLASKMQYIICKIGFHGFLLIQGRAPIWRLPSKVTDGSLPAWQKNPSGAGMVS